MRDKYQLSEDLVMNIRVCGKTQSIKKIEYVSYFSYVCQGEYILLDAMDGIMIIKFKA